MDHADDDGGNNDDVFVYMGGSVPQHLRETITHVRVHQSVKIITKWAFKFCRNLVSIEMHDGVEIIEEYAFNSYCRSLKGIKLPGVRIIGKSAFAGCRGLENLEFGDKLEIIGDHAFSYCTSLRSIKLPNVRVIGMNAFYMCEQLAEVDCSKDLERIGYAVFWRCYSLRRIAIPLKDNLLENDYVFRECDNLSQVNLVGGIHKTVSSLLLESWTNEMNNEINQINRDLPTTPTNEKATAIQRWMRSVLQRIEHLTSEHYALLKEDMTQLELALWKANLPNVDAASRVEARVTCGASIIIPHVLSFLNDNDAFPLVECNH